MAILINGTANNDTLEGLLAEDYEINGLAGNDLLTAASGNDLLMGGDGNDTIVAGGGDDTVLGGDGRDTILDRSGNLFQIDAGAGNDFVQTNLETDALSLATSFL